VVGGTGCSICLLQTAPLKPKKGSKQAAAKKAGGQGDDMRIFPILRGHTGPVRAIAQHPLLPVWATVGVDKTLRIWEGGSRKLVYINRLWDRGCSIAFHPQGHQVVIGTEEGEIIIMACGRRRSKGGGQELNVAEWTVAARRNVSSPPPAVSKAAGVLTAAAPATGAGVILPRLSNGETSPAAKREDKRVKSGDVTALKFSPDGSLLAVASRDKMVYMLSVELEYKRVATCRGTSTPVIRMDFSVDGTILQTNDLAREILFWDVATGRQVSPTLSPLASHSKSLPNSMVIDTVVPDFGLCFSVFVVVAMMMCS